MKSSSSRLKFLFIIVGLFLVLYFSRYFIFATVVQTFLSHISLEKFEYKKRVWEDGNLIYEDVALGDQLHTAQLRLTPEFTFFPFHLSLEVYFTQPHFKLSSQTKSPFTLALFTPTKWTLFKLDIEHGTLSVDEEPLGFIDLVSGQESTAFGTLILSEEGSPYCTCEMSYRDHDLYYDLKCEAASVLHLHSFMNLFAFTPPFQLQGGRLDAELKGTLSNIQGTLSGSNLQFATSQGDFDFHRLKLKGKWSDTISIEGQFEGGRFTNGTIVIDETKAQISFDPEKALLLSMKGHLALGEIQGPFTCEAEGDTTLEGKLQFLGPNHNQLDHQPLDSVNDHSIDIPFSISHEGTSSFVHADFNNVPLPWLKAIAPFEEGLGSAQVRAFFENEKLKTIELKKLNLTLVKMKELSCSSILGEAVINGLTFIKQASLKVENLSYSSGFFNCKNGIGTVALAENQFLISELKGMVILPAATNCEQYNHIPGKVIWHGPLDKIEGEFSASAPLSILGIEDPAHLNGIFRLENTHLTCQGDLTAFSDKISLQGDIDLKTQKCRGIFKSSPITLSKYSTFFPEGSVEFKGKIDSKELEVNCIGTDLVFQTETQLLQVPGRSIPFKLKWSLQDNNLFAQMNIPPSTLHLKTIPSPIYIESGNLTLKEGVLDISQLEACLEDIVFQGDLAYWNCPKPHLQLKSSSLKGPLRDLSIFEKRVQGWEGHFVCGKEEFLFDGDLDGSLPQIHFKAHVDNLSHRFTPELALSQGTLELTYESIENEFNISEMTGTLNFLQRELPFHLPKLTGKEDHFAFSFEIPTEKMFLEGEVDKQVLILHQAQVGLSRITKPLHATYQDGSWELQGSAMIDLESAAHYVAFFPEMNLPWPSMQGIVDVRGSITQDNASVDLASNGIKIGDLTLPIFKGHIEREENRFKTNNLSIGDAHLTALAVYENKAWIFPEWTILWKELNLLNLQGSARLEQNICLLKAAGTWKEATIQSEIIWDLKTQQGSRGHLTFEQDALKVVLSTNDLHYKEGKLEASHVQTTVNHPLLKESIIAPLVMSWTPERITFQGPFSEGAYENDLFKLKGREIHALYENGVLHYQTKLHLNDVPLKAKGYFTEGGQGALKLFEGDHELQVTFATFFEVTSIEGKLFGIDCSLTKKGTLYEGRLKIETSDPFATLLKKPEWKQIENLEFVGLLAPDNFPGNFKGTVSGHDVILQGYLLNSVEATVDYRPTQFEIRQLKIDDKAGQLVVKECRGMRSHPLKAWEIAIPHLRGQLIQPSLLRKLGAPTIEPKPFQIRQLTLTNVTGIMGRPLTFHGQGSFYFTQKEKRDPSLFDLPRAFLKEWGLDLALLSPARGSATIELAQGKMIFSSLQETFSDGNHSEFYLAEDEPSYIDLSGGLFLNLRMKQNAALKLAEPFTISVRGTWEKPLYTLR